jgi:hypothetical protein
MAFQLVQEFKFEGLDYSYDPRGDVLDISFGPPAPAIALQIEDWLAIQVRISPPALQGYTIVGFKKIFEKINQYIEEELPERMERLASARLSIAYDDQSDTLAVRAEEDHHGLEQSHLGTGSPSIFEPLSRGGPPTRTENSVAGSLRNIYVERSLPSKDIIGLKILHFTECGQTALEGFLGAIADTLLDPGAQRDENIHLITNALVQRVDWQKLAAQAG